MLKRTRTIGAASALLGGMLVLSACGGQAAQNSASAPENPGADTARSDTRPGPESTHGNSGISASDCAASDFSVDLNAQPGKPGQFLLAMTNNSDKTCTVGGWVNLTPLNAANQPIQVPTKNVEYPGAPKDFQLKPHNTAFAGVQVETGSQGDPNTYVATGFTAQPSDMQGEVTATIMGTNGQPVTEVPLKSIETGTLQPVPDGVLR